MNVASYTRRQALTNITDTVETLWWRKQIL